MNRIKNGFNAVILIFLMASVFSCKTRIKKPEKIDRFSLVTRHNVISNEFDSLSSLSIGNGKFAFTVDATGLQTFPELYKNGVCLGTQSEWGWHSFPNTENYSLNESYKYFEVEGREIPYAIQWNEPGRKQDAANYFRMNPHRLQLANFGFELLNADKSKVEVGGIKNINQNLNLWEGLIVSSFDVENENIGVSTCVHPEKDLVEVEISSQRVSKGLISLKLGFPYPTGDWGGDASDWKNVSLHQSEIIKITGNSAIFKHEIDTTVYFAELKWSEKAKLKELEPHIFILQPETGSPNFSCSLEFRNKNDFAELPEPDITKQLSANSWEEFWQSGGAVDFSGTTDPRAFELERRVVLSQYLTRIQCAGNFPPQETGLTYNSWYGKPHLEMHWWHGVHFAYWNRTELLEKSLNYYFEIFQKAKTKADKQGYEGVRWPKMTDLLGNDSPSGVGEFLIWQQPHIIYFAELFYRQNPGKETLEKYAPLVFATADFMADFARHDEKNNRYILGPPLIPAQESLEKEKTFNPPFEIAYWHWGLSIAQKWRERMNLPETENWQKVIDGLPSFAQKKGLYLAAESAPDSYENEHYYSDHPMVLGAFGMLPETVEMDTAVMAATFDHIERIWNWDRTWGWDYPMAAMCATRLGKPDQAVDLLLKDVVKNTYLKNGHNYQTERLRIYLPGNGGLLTAVAMMCAGFEGNKIDNPGFPKDWNVKWENLKPVF
ncbi:MAG TPA: hypothetical protein PLC80_02585 [Draconibacterium sp.]|nr:hypothetical protein [Draconibacterium sp.]